MGFRPEEVEINDRPFEEAMEAEVITEEILGPNKLFTLKSNDEDNEAHGSF